MRLMSVRHPRPAAHTLAGHQTHHQAHHQGGFLSQRTWGILTILAALVLIPYWMAKTTNDKTAAKLFATQGNAAPGVKPTVAQKQAQTQAQTSSAEKPATAATTISSTTSSSSSTPNPDRFGLSFGHGDLQGKPGLMVSACAGTPLDMGNPDKSQCNPTQGDSSCRTALPVLCVLKDGSTADSVGLVNTINATATTAVTVTATVTKAESSEKPQNTGLNLHTGWVSGTLGATAPVAGFVIGSLAQANARCAAELGPGWRMAELHDATGSGGANASNGGGLVGKRGQGLTSQQTRHWVYVNDQKANCWDAQTQ